MLLTSPTPCSNYTRPFIIYTSFPRMQCNQTKDKNIDACINNSTGSICGGENSGKCICGQCECIQPTRDAYTRWGEYTDKKGDRHTYRNTDKQGERENIKKTKKNMDPAPYIQAYIVSLHSYRQTYRLICILTDRHTARHT